MTVGLLSFGTRADRGWGVRVRSLLQMISSFSSVEVFHTEKEEGLRERAGTSVLEGVSNGHSTRVPSDEGTRTRVSRLLHYYRNDAVAVSESVLSELEDISAFQIESLDLMFLAKSLNLKGKPLVLDEHNVYWNLLKYGMFDSPFFRGPIGRSGPTRRVLGPWLAGRAKRFELKSIKDSDAVLVTSALDAEWILSEAPTAKGRIHVIPNCVDVSTYPYLGTALPGEDAKRNVIFVGRLDYQPNLDAVNVICEHIAPHFDDSVRFQIVGGPVPSLPRHPRNVEFLGIVPDIRPVLQHADVCIAPLRFGSGTRIKIIEYLAMGKPIVSTGIGCEGLLVESGRNILVAEEPAEQADMIGEVLRSDSLARKLGSEGRKLAEERYDWRVYARDLKAVYEAVGAI